MLVAPCSIREEIEDETICDRSCSSIAPRSNGPNNNGPGLSTQVYTCLGNIALQVVATLANAEELTFGKLISSASVCVDAAIAIFSAPSNSTPSSPEIDINSSSSQGTFSGSVQSTTVGNCTDYRKTLQFNFSVPFEMVVGPPGSQEAFNASPGGSTDNKLVAQQVFQQYGSHIANKTTSGPSQSEVNDIGPHTQVTFTLPIEQFYQSGEARVVRTDDSTVILPWFFTDGYQQAGPITYTTLSCLFCLRLTRDALHFRSLLFEIPYRLLWNDVQRESVKPGLALASRLFCCAAFHNKASCASGH
jgi:hypothetical protein